MKKIVVIVLFVVACATGYAAHASPLGGYLAMYGGRTTVNSYRDKGATALELEDKQPYSGNKFEFSISLLNEGHLSDERYTKRDGLAFEGWWDFFSTPAHLFTLSLGTGPYLFNATERPKGDPDGSYSDLQSMGWLVSIGARYNMLQDTALVFEAHRVMSKNSTDADVVLVGLARTF